MKSASTRLSGWPLLLARMAFLALAGAYLSLYLMTQPARLAQPPDPPGGFGWSAAQKAAVYDQAPAWLTAIGVAFSRSNYVLVPVYIGLAVFIFWRRSDDWMALFLSSMFVIVFGSSPLTSLAEHHAGWALAANVNDSLGSVVLVAYFYLFPDGRFTPPWTRWPALVVAVIQAWRLVDPALYDRLLAIPTGLCLGLVPVAQILRYRRSGPDQRRQIKWVVFGLGLGLMPLTVYVLTMLAFPGLGRPDTPGLMFSLVGAALWGSFVLIMPASIVTAILRSRLWDIDLIIRRTLVYSLLSGLLALTYFGVVIVLQGAVTALGGGRSEWITVASTLAVAALVAPLRTRVQGFIDRRFYRRKYDAARVLADFGAAARDETDLNALTGRLTGAVQETMEPESMAVWLKPGGRA